ncbi:MAG TPA: methyltransferase domain-containing protein [Longimicrobiales bacterium]
MSTTVDLKQEVREFWDQNTCGTGVTQEQRFSKQYFDEIEAYRYATEPEIFSFAQFTRYHGQKLLEVGVGAGTDFLQWVRAGTRAHGVDLTPAAVEHVQHRLDVYGLRAEDVRVADAEALPFAEGTFDVVYSWGVIHHSPDTERALHELVRVTRPGGTCKIMIYNRHSLCALLMWVRQALLRGRPWKSLSWCLYHYVESKGTKAYTRAEVRRMLARLPAEEIRIATILTHSDRLASSGPIRRSVARLLAFLLGGNRAGWFMTIEFRKRSA